MNTREYIMALGFAPKDGTNGIFRKAYADYAIEVDFEEQSINYGNKIIAENRATQNFSQPENFVVLECIDRLLAKGYKPQNIVLEKTWPSGHGTSGRLDICVNHDDGTPYLLIECKRHGKWFEEELRKINKDGGQLFTYFQLSGGKADVLMLYASEIRNGKTVYRNEIIKIEDEYRNGDAKDIFEKWNKLTKDNGIFEPWAKPYNFQSKALTKEQLKEIKAKDSSFIFNRFLEILRHNVVSDKSNAFNKIFTLFLCKVYDETSTNTGEELKFQWLEGQDTHESFQLRLTDLYAEGMKKFLDRKVSDFNQEDFEKQSANLDSTLKEFLLDEVKKLRLEKNNEFAFKEVYDHASFEENAKVVKEVVELLQGYRIRYNKRQQYLSDFFELLLTTGLKQEAGQFFTPVPIARFIIKSLPLDNCVTAKLASKDGKILPYMIDYAAGSGHFITEYMHEVQNILNACDETRYIDETQTLIRGWRNDHFRWAPDYVYGIEKDYRLVKVGKVGCYLHGDGLAHVILSDGLANFQNKEYKEILHKDTCDGKKDNPRFDILLSNPPYSVSAFRQTTRDYYTNKDFDLYDSLTDNSSEIECLFVERAKQLLKDGGMAGIILPSSILNNTGIYTKTREMILRYFDIVAVAELGGNTFMATNTNTVALFLRRRDNYSANNIKASVENCFRTLNDVTINGIEKPMARYATHVWENIAYTDYLTLLQRNPNEKITTHEIYLDYQKKYPAKTKEAFMETVLTTEAEKLLYFILTYPQQMVVVKSGEKNEEKQFLGYEFSNRRGNEGIHAIQRGKDIDECTKLFDAQNYDNPEKASTYIYRAFKGDFTSPISESMKKHVFRMRLTDMIAFDRVPFEKNISLSIKKKEKFSLKWDNIRISDSTIKIHGDNEKIPVYDIMEQGRYPVATQDSSRLFSGFTDKKNPIKDVPLILFGDHSCTVKYIDVPFFRGADGTVLLKPKSKFNVKYYFYVLECLVSQNLTTTKYERHNKTLQNLYIPLPPKDIQEKIVEEIGCIENNMANANNRIVEAEASIENILSGLHENMMPLKEIAIYVATSTQFKDIVAETYVTTDNMLQNKMGVIPFTGIANTNSITRYAPNDILVSNIRPYLKKIWLADKNGGCSKDVLVLRTIDDILCLPKYLYYMIRRDAFFDYAMEGKKGVKMPRGNKEEIMKYKIPVPTAEKQQEIIGKIEKLEDEIKAARSIIEKATEEKQLILDKYL